jgi:glycosyltransferase involved in cell wall biosynthesis
MLLDLTIAICTRNRASSLARTLTSITNLAVPDGASWEVIVVNNGSSDSTDAVIASFSRALPIRREYEANAGLSRARNKAVAEAQGRYIVWTDDDVIVNRNWVSAYLAAFKRWPQAGVFGGKILPELEKPVPGWLADSLEIVAGAYAKRDFGDRPMPLTIEPRVIPFGANYAIRSEDQRTRLYNPALGAGSPTGINGEETDVICALLKKGTVGYWVPDAVVAHCIPRERQTIRYIRQFYMAHGRALGYEGATNGTPLLFGAPRWLWRRILADGRRYMFSRVFSPAPTWMGHLTSYYVDLGMLDQFRSDAAE